MDSQVNPAQRPCIPLHSIYMYIYRQREKENRSPKLLECRGLAYLYTAYIYI